MSDLDVPLDNVAGVEEADRLDKLVDRVVVLLLVKQFIGVLLDDLALDLGWELGILGDLLRLHVETLLHQCVDFDVVFHLV